MIATTAIEFGSVLLAHRGTSALTSPTRDKDAALRFMKKTLKRHGQVEAITTDGLGSYKAAMTELGNAHKQEVGRWANNRVENSHLSLRQ